MTIKLFLTITAALFFGTTKAQIIDSIEAKINYGSTISDVQLLMELDKIDYNKVYLKNLNNDSSNFFITAKEYWNGKVTKSDTLLPLGDSKKYFGINRLDSLPAFTLITKPLGDSVLFNYRLSGLSITRKYKRINSDDYSLRDGLMTNEEFKKIPTNQTIPLFVYSLPYEDPEKPNYKFYCALTADGVPPEKWWEKYKVKHYIIVEIKILTH